MYGNLFSSKRFAKRMLRDILLPMEIGISTASFFTKYYTEEAIVPIARMGASLCEVFFATHSEYTPRFAITVNRELRKAQAYAPLRVHSVHALTNQFEPELFSVNDRAERDALKTYRSVLDVAKRIGARYYTFHGAAMLKKAVKYSFDYPHIIRKVNALCEIAEEYGVTFCYENVHWAYFCNPEYFLSLKEACPKMGGVLDIKQAAQSGYDYTEYLAAFADRLRTVHLCDIAEDGQVALPGRGKFNFKTLFERLGEQGYSGPCLMEVYAKNYRDFSELQESYRYLCDCAERAGYTDVSQG